MTFNLPELRRAVDKRKNRNEYSIFDDFFNDFYALPTSFISKSGTDLSPRIDISETDKEYHLEAELPGISEEAIDVKIDNNILTIKGNKEEKKEEKDKNYHVKERYYGSFQRSVSLPANIAEDKIDARFTDGVLHIVIPKKGEEASKKITIRKG